MERRLKEVKLRETVEKLQHRIAARFPDSGLSQVAAELVAVTREALDRAASIRRPNFWIRGGLVVVAILAAAGVIHHFATSPDMRTGAREFVEFLEVTKGAGVYLVAAAAFLITLEIRYKRRKALRAVHELRAMAHLIDMHQLGKSPERIGTKDGPKMDDGRLMTPDEVRSYLNSCTELLAILSKIGQLYVQDFSDAPAGAAVDQFENLATGLTSKIWQKIMLLEQLHAEAETRAATGEPAAP